ncbi:MAG: 2-oxoglutarate dehydrogenase E1 component, partial [Gammaproteobacteria bacterium]
RHPKAVSNLDVLSHGGFLTVIDDGKAEKSAVTRIIFCTGKIYYELLEKNTSAHIALVRIEQLYPFPDQEIKALLNQYTQGNQWYWCQEEPENQGAWLFIKYWFEKIVDQNKNSGKNLICIARPAAAAPAVGSLQMHLKEQAALIDRALGV